MSPDTLALGRRAVACPGWRWMAGMLIVCPTFNRSYRILAGVCEGSILVWSEPGPARWLTAVGIWPDLADPATLGCMLALVREAWRGRSHIMVRADLTVSPPGWWVALPVVAQRTFATEAEALVAALEAAPGR